MSRFIFPSCLVVLLILAVAVAQDQPPPKTTPQKFPEPYNSGSEKGKTPPMSAAEAVAKMKLPPGFKATVFASEPDVQNPIAMTWDGRGRIWVAENYTYAESGVRFDPKLRDRILIFEDKNRDGRFSSRKVFTDQLQKLTSVAVGHGGVWVMCPPQLLFIPDRNGDDVPDGPPEVVLDGFTIPGGGIYHTLANGLRFGPDGWLYGRCGHSSPGELGRPGTPAAQRTPLRGGMWRYHPLRKVVEVMSYGTVNPWGHDWNEHGELFFINTVIGHLWHNIPGAHYNRTSKEPNQRAYQLIDMHADHWNFAAKKSTGLADGSGGGHSHVGMMIYLGDNWPAAYRGRLMTINMFGHRINQEILTRQGSGYVGKRADDIVFVPDPWFRGMELSYGPDGGVFMLDWSDTGDYHDHSGVHRTSGRIYKITFGDAKPSPIGDLRKLGVKELVSLHTHANEWFTRQARRELAERAQEKSELAIADKQLRELFEKQSDIVVKLRALWTLYTLGAADEPWLRTLLRHPDEHVRVWAIRLLTDTWPLDNVMSKRPASSVAGPETTADPALLVEFAKMAAEDPSGLVRLALASTLQRLPFAQRAPLAAALMSRKEDAKDHNLPLLIWYGLIPVADSDPAALASLAGKTELPTTRKFIARRLGETIDKDKAAVNTLLEITLTKSEAFQSDILDGLAEGLKGQRKATKPAAWDTLASKLATSPNSALRNRVRDLSVILGDPVALAAARKVAVDSKAEIVDRKAALEAVLAARPPDLFQLCEQLLSVPLLNVIAARGLATFDDPAIGPVLVRAYPQFNLADRPQLVAVLVSRPAYAKALLDAVAEKKVPRADISAFDARQIRGFNDDNLNKKLSEVWGEVRDSPADKKALIAKWKAELSADVLAKADKSNGRVLFNKTCATCHVLYGEGATVGPDLTGGGRQNLDFLLGKIFDPSAAVSADFRMSVLSLKDGRVLNGIVTAKTERTLTLKTATDSLTVELGDIESTKESALSLMPDGMLEGLTTVQVRDLIAYLKDTSQAPAPKRKQLLVWADTRSVSAPYGAQHKSVPHAADIIEKLGKDKGLYDTTIRRDSDLITKRATGEGAKDLRSFDAIFFIGMREVGLSTQQRADLMSFIKEDGKGFVAAHTASTAFMSWPEFGEMLGGRFDGHPWGITKAPVILEDPKFPAAKHFPAVFTLNEEFYQTKDFSRDKIRVVLRLDASKLPNNLNIKRKDNDFPLAWAKTHGKGRVFYSALGHANEAWDNPDLQTMWLEAIKWSMGLTDADVTPRPLAKEPRIAWPNAGTGGLLVGALR